MKKIMVVDDSRIAYAQLGRLLKGTDYEITKYCRDGLSAVKAYEACMPDLVTMDIIMPDMDGFGEMAGRQDSDGLLPGV